MADTDALVDFIRAAVKTDPKLIDSYLSGEFGKIQAVARLLKSVAVLHETRIVASEAAQSFAQKSTSAGSGADYDFTGITTDRAMLVLEGLSYTTVGASTLDLWYSLDGLAWSNFGTIRGGLVPADTCNGILHIVGLRAGRALFNGATDNTAFPAETATQGAANPGSQIVGLSARWNAGATIDAGLVRLMTSGGL